MRIGGGKGIIRSCASAPVLELRFNPALRAPPVEQDSHPPSGPFEFRCREIGGGKGIRTPDLLIANETLYQLSYTPIYE